MNIEKTECGMLTITVEDGDIDILTEIISTSSDTDHGFLADMLDRFGFSTNGQFFPVNPEDIGALTDAPIITDEIEYKDDGTKNVIGNVWWFPDYQVVSFAETLLHDGTVSFSYGGGEEPAPRKPKNKL